MNHKVPSVHRPCYSICSTFQEPQVVSPCHDPSSHSAPKVQTVVTVSNLVDNTLLWGLNETYTVCYPNFHTLLYASYLYKINEGTIMFYLWSVIVI